MVPFIVSALAVFLASSQPGTVSGQSRITKAATVRLRRAPSTTAPIADELPLGTELVVLEEANQGALWYHVKTADGRVGWILGSFTEPFDRGRREQAIEAIVIERLSAASQVRDAPFATHLQLFTLVERTAEKLADSGAQARFALYRLRSMNDVFGSIPFRRDNADPYRAWIRQHQEAARYNEPAGRWKVDPHYVLQVHERYRDSATADDIAWFFVQNGLYGECEGYVPCYVSWQNALNGEYLRLHPRGRHADESNADIALSLNGAMDDLRNFPALAEFDPKISCVELQQVLDPLRAAVTASNAARQADALTAIDRVAELCR